MNVPMPAPPRSDSRAAAVIVAGFERIAWTFVQAFVGALVASETLDLKAGQAAAVGAISATLTALIALVPGVPTALPFYTDLFLRAARTFAATFLGVLAGANWYDYDADFWPSAFAAGVSAVVAVVKGSAAQFFGERTPATVPGRFDVSSSASPKQA